MPNTAAATLLIVDDSSENLALLDTLLSPHYQARAAAGSPRLPQYPGHLSVRPARPSGRGAGPWTGRANAGDPPGLPVQAKIG